MMIMSSMHPQKEAGSVAINLQDQISFSLRHMRKSLQFKAINHT